MWKWTNIFVFFKTFFIFKSKYVIIFKRLNFKDPYHFYTKSHLPGSPFQDLAGGFRKIFLPHWDAVSLEIQHRKLLGRKGHRNFRNTLPDRCDLHRAVGGILGHSTLFHAKVPACLQGKGQGH